MFILKSILAPIQSEFKNSFYRAQLFTSVLLAMLFPMGTARSSHLLRIIRTVFSMNISARCFYIFMASPKLPWERLWASLWRLIPSPLTDGRLILAADDSINPKTGKKIHGCDYHFDHAAKTNQSTFAWSQNIVLVGLLKVIHGRFACLPLSWRFYRSKKSIQKGFKTKIEQVVEMVRSIYREFNAPVILVVDNWFASKTLFKPLQQILKSNFHLLSRLRTNTKLYDIKPPKYRGRGRRPKYGQCVGNIKEIGKCRKRLAKNLNINLYGKLRAVTAYSKVYCLKTLGVPVRIVWVYRRKSMVALFTTDLSLSIEKIITYYGARWKIESGFKELKQDIGSQKTQARTKNAVTNHLNFCMMATAIAWVYADRLQSQPKRRRSSKRNTSYSFSDVRHHIAQSFSNEDFLKVLFNSSKTTKNKFISTILRLAV